jgi:prepilin peptidase dependent protein B
MLNHGSRQRALQSHGLSIVEFMVGIAVGLFIVGGATKLFVDYLGSNRTLLLETRVNQDLRAAADLVVRDLRRASYWRNATAGISTVPSVLPASNPYRTVDYNAGTETLTYSYSKDAVDAIDATTEAFGVKRGVVSGKGVLQLQTAGGWQTITDPGTLDIPSVNGLTITPTASRVVELWDECPCIFESTCFKRQFENPDPVTTVKGIHFDNRPRITIRQYDLRLRAQSSTDPKIVREIRELVRVRNDQLDGICPS